MKSAFLFGGERSRSALPRPRIAVTVCTNEEGAVRLPIRTLASSRYLGQAVRHYHPGE